MTFVYGRDAIGQPRRPWRVERSLYTDPTLTDLERGVACREALGCPECIATSVVVKRVPYADAATVLGVTPGPDWPSGKDLLIVTAHLRRP